MNFQSLSVKICLIALTFAGLGATTVMVQPLQTARVGSPANIAGFHKLYGSIQNLQDFLESVDPSETGLIQLAAEGIC